MDKSTGYSLVKEDIVFFFRILCCIILGGIIRFADVRYIIFRLRQFSRREIIFFREGYSRLEWGRILFRLKNQGRISFTRSEFGTYLRFLKLTSPQLLSWLTDARPSSRKSYTLPHPDQELVYSAWHEAGHVVTHWFTMNPQNILQVAVSPTHVLVAFEEIVNGKPYRSSSTPDELFSDICCYMGCEISAQLLTSINKTSFQRMDGDIVIMTLIAHRIAQKTAYLEIDVLKLMYFYFRRSYEVTLELIKKHEKDVRAVAEALLKYETLDYNILLDILGPRPQMEKTLYKQFIEGRFYFDETTDNFASLPNRCANEAQRTGSLQKLFKKSPMIKNFITRLQNKFAFIKQKVKRNVIQIISG